VEHRADRFPGVAQETDTPFERVKELETKVSQLQEAVESHAVIDQAIGVIVAVGRVSTAEAWDVLRETSMCTNVKLRHVAALVVTWGETGHLATDIRDELAVRLQHRIPG
jgi:hypothetical protein